MYVEPLNWKPPPNLPVVHAGVPATLPVFPFPEASAAVDPEVSSRFQYPTKPLAEGGGADGAVIVKEADLDDPFRAAVTVAVWLAVTDPPVTTKDAVFELAGTEADAGAVTGPEDVIVNVAPPDPVAELSVATHELGAPAPMEAGLHDSDETVTVVAGGMSVSATVLLTPLSVAVTDALVLPLTLAAFAVNAPELEPPATVTDVGTARLALLLDSPTAVAAPAALLSVTVHDEELDAVTEVGLHETPLRTVDGAVAVIVPPVAVIGSAEPSADAPFAFVTPMFVLVSVEEGPKVTVATTPFEIGAMFMPHTTQRYVPEPLAHERDFPAAVSAPPGATFTTETSAGEY